MQDFKFVQASVSCLQSVYLAVVTQLKRQHMSITRRVTSSIDVCVVTSSQDA